MVDLQLHGNHVQQEAEKSVAHLKNKVILQLLYVSSRIQSAVLRWIPLSATEDFIDVCFKIS